MFSGLRLRVNRGALGAGARGSGSRDARLPGARAERGLHLRPVSRARPPPRQGGFRMRRPGAETESAPALQGFGDPGRVGDPRKGGARAPSWDSGARGARRPHPLAPLGSADRKPGRAHTCTHTCRRSYACPPRPQPGRPAGPLTGRRPRKKHSSLLPHTGGRRDAHPGSRGSPAGAQPALSRGTHLVRKAQGCRTSPGCGEGAGGRPGVGGDSGRACASCRVRSFESVD